MSERARVIEPGATLGVLGSGQLGRMFAIAARQLGYRVHTYSPRRDTPTGQVADEEHVGPYGELDAVRRFAAGVDVVTFEFENVPAATAAAAAEHAPVRPDGSVLHICQHRQREKTFLRDRGLPVTPFRVVRSRAELTPAVDALGTPCVLKTAGFGYDGKGQVRIDDASPAALDDAWRRLSTEEAVLEAWVHYEREISVVAARGLDGEFLAYAPFENHHERHILDLSLSPASIPADVARSADALARRVLQELDVVGVLCVEMFLLPDGALLINELAPRPHNSGHLTVDAHVTSQFEQQVRTICGLPLGSVAQPRPAAMVNLLGEAWRPNKPRWSRALALPDVHLHLYGKREVRGGRKMGHITALAETLDEARARALAARRALARDD